MLRNEADSERSLRGHLSRGSLFQPCLAGFFDSVHAFLAGLLYLGQHSKFRDFRAAAE